jgi:hypothetical protein
LIEAHGVMFDLTPENLSLLDLHTDLDVLLRRDDLPTAPDTSSNGSGKGPGDADRMTVEQFLATVKPGMNAELDKARRAQSDAAEAQAVLREALERSTNEHRVALRRREQAVAALEQAGAALAAAQPGTTAGSASAQDNETLAAQRDELDALVDAVGVELERVDRGLAELSAIDTRPIEVLIDAIRNPDAVEYVPSERAQELADEFVRLQAAVAELEQRLEAEGRSPEAAEAALEAARTELHQAERGMAKPDLSPDDVAQLEAAHEAVLEAERRASGRFNRGRKGLDEALAKEQAILDRVGFPTWSAYVMGAGLLAIDPLAEQRLEKARFEFEAAEANWAQLTASLESNEEHKALLDRLEAVYLEAFDLLGGEEPDDLEAALRDHREAKREVTTDELVGALVYQLELVGLNLGEAASLDRTVVVAEAFLEESNTINQRLSELEAERQAIVETLTKAEAKLDELAERADDGAGVIDVSSSPEPASPVSEEDVAALEAELTAAEEQERDASEQLEAREALVDAATQVHAVATSRLMRLATELATAQLGDALVATAPGFEVPVDVDPDAGAGQEALEFYLLARLAGLRNASFAGSVPLVIDDAFTVLPNDDVRPFLQKLEQMAEAVQIIYLTDDATVTNWAIEVGFQRAAVVEAPGPFA